MDHRNTKWFITISNCLDSEWMFERQDGIMYYKSLIFNMIRELTHF